MTDLRTAAQQALERLRKYHYGNGFIEDAECIAAFEAALAQPDPQDAELSAALGWPGGISEPVLDRTQLLRMVAALRLAFQQALEALTAHADLLGTMYLKMDAITALRAVLAQQAEPLNLADPAVQKRLASQWGYVPAAAQAEPVEPVQPGAWVASKDGRVIYDYDFTHDVVLRVMGDFENDEQRISYAKQIVDKLNAAPPRRTMVPLTEEEIKTAFHAARNAKLGASQDNSRHRLSVIEIARAVEKASWEKNK